MRTALLNMCVALVATAFAAGCESGAAPRSVVGQLQAGAYDLTSAVVIAQSAQGRTFVTPVNASGRFAVAVPSGASYRLLLAQRLANGRYGVISRIAWPTPVGAARWARLATGATVLLPAIHPVSATGTSGLRTMDVQSSADDSTDSSDDLEAAGEQCGQVGEASGEGGHDDGECGNEEQGVGLCGAEGSLDSESDGGDVKSAEAGGDAQDHDAEDQIDAQDSQDSCDA